MIREVDVSKITENLSEMCIPVAVNICCHVNRHVVRMI